MASSYGVTGAISPWMHNDMLMGQIRRMKIEHEKEIKELKLRHQTDLNSYKIRLSREYSLKYSSEIAGLKNQIEALKIKHKQDMLLAKQKYDKEKAQALKIAIEKCKLECTQQVDKLKSDYNFQIAGLKKQYNELNGRFDESQANLAQRNQLIAEMEKLHAKALKDEKSLVVEAEKKIKEMISVTDDKKARNKKLALGAGGVLSAYLLMKE